MDLPSNDVTAPSNIVAGFSSAALATMPTVYAPGCLSGRRVLVSGGGTGLGRAMAFLAARLGAEVMICGRRAEKLEATAADMREHLGAAVHTRAMTIRDPEQVAALFDAAGERMGGVDVLVNNGGGQFPVDSLELSPKGWNAVVDTNLNGTWHMMQEAARRWRDGGREGSIVNIVLVVGRGIPYQAHSCAARAGVIHLSRSVAVEWAPLGIRVNCIAPGQIATEGLNTYSEELRARIGTANPMRRAGDAWDIAEAMVYLCAASGRFVTGETLVVDGGQQMLGMIWPLGMPAWFAGEPALEHVTPDGIRTMA